MLQQKIDHPDFAGAVAFVDDPDTSAVYLQDILGFNVLREFVGALELTDPAFGLSLHLKRRSSDDHGARSRVPQHLMISIQEGVLPAWKHLLLIMGVAIEGFSFTNGSQKIWLKDWNGRPIELDVQNACSEAKQSAVPMHPSR